MHLLCLPSWFSHPQNLLSGSFFKEQADLFADNQYKVGVLYLHRISNLAELQYCIQPNFLGIENGLQICRSNYLPLLPQTSKSEFKHFLKIADRQFLKYVHKFGKPDVLFAQSAYLGGVIAEFISKQHQIPYVISEHSSSLIRTERQHKINPDLAAKAYQNAQQIFFVSKFLQSEIQQKYQIDDAKCKVIPNALSPFFIDQSFKEIPKMPFYFIMVANFIPLKNHEKVIQAFAKIASPKSRLILVGDGVLKTEMQQLVKNLNLADKVTFTGSLNREDLKNAISEAHCLISASEIETFGMSIIEAHALGKPVIAFASGGPNELIFPDNGILLYDKSIANLAKSMQDMQQNYDGFNRKKIQKSALQYHPKEIFKAYHNSLGL